MTMPIGKKLVAYHIARLKDKNAEVRLKSIQELAQLADTDALPALEEVYKHDSDANVRRAAQLAGKTIFNLSRSSQK
jgi:HEAT repeat protein